MVSVDRRLKAAELIRTAGTPMECVYNIQKHFSEMIVAASVECKTHSNANRAELTSV